MNFTGYPDPVLQLILMTGFFLVGLCMGSFASAISHRTLLGESWIGSWHQGPERSRCPHCHHNLRWYELLPLLSWCALRGRCGHCGNGISWLYPAIEFFGACLAVVIYLLCGVTWLCFSHILLLPFHLACLLMLVREKRIPRAYLMFYVPLTLMVAMMTVVVWV